MVQDKGASGERIAKRLARAGLCSRREAERWIAEGRVAVDGKVLATPAFVVGDDSLVAVDGKPLAEPEPPRLFRYHKPAGLLTTARDPEGRPTIFEKLPRELPRLIAVGRLDLASEGLLLLTNDGELARHLELPSTGWLRRYRVRVKGKIDQASLDRLAQGITLDGIHYAGIEAKLNRLQGANCWLTMGLREGKNREVKRVLEHLGLTVNRLIRLSFGPFQLGELPEGGLLEVRTRVLRDQLGSALLKEAGADLAAPLDVPQRQEARPERARGTTRVGRPRPRHAAPHPEPKKPKGRPLPGPRKHVSALRTERDKRKEESGRPRRQRIEHAETADRKGRVVAVERLLAAPAPTKKAASEKKWQRSGKHEAQSRSGVNRRNRQLPKTR